MTRSYRYRLNPTAAQERTLFLWLGLTRELYNAALQERRDAYKKQHVSISVFDQMKMLPGIREVRPEFNTVPIVVLRGVLRRLDKAFSGFFRRCKNGEKPGFPRFKSRDRFNSISIDDLSGKPPIVAGGQRVAIPKLGKIKFHQADGRLIQGTPKALRLVFDLGKWYVTFACVDVPKKLLPKTDLSVGVDLGLYQFAATSEGQIFPNPRAAATARLRTERAARRLARRKKGGKRRSAARRLLAKCQAHVSNIRRENHIAVARSLVREYDTIYVEDLNIKGLARSTLAKSVNDAGWGNFLGWLACKAEEAGREIVKVNPSGTSQKCSQCGSIGPHKGLEVRIYHCLDCGMVLDRDINAARNIQGVGLLLRGAASLVKGRQRSAKPKLAQQLKNVA